MGFELKKVSKSSLITVKEGPQMAKRKGAPVTNEIGVNFKFDAKEKVLSGKMMFFEVKTDLADERELYEAIEKAINEVLKARM